MDLPVFSVTDHCPSFSDSISANSGVSRPENVSLTFLGPSLFYSGLLIVSQVFVGVIGANSVIILIFSVSSVTTAVRGGDLNHRSSR